MATKEFKGKLGKPSAPARPIEGGDLEQWKFDRFVHGLVGVHLLCEHYGLANIEDPTARYVALSMFLAREFVPYFQPEANKGGRPKTVLRPIKTWARVQRVMDKNPGISKAAAMKQAGVTSSHYYAALKQPNVVLMMQGHDRLGPEEFWRFYEEQVSKYVSA
jgi:hypothetical protein